MPLCLNDLLKGARSRAFFVYDKLRDELPVTRFFIGMEGGVFLTGTFDDSPSQAILQNWVYVYDGQNGNFGCSAGIVLPEEIKTALIDEKRELAEVIDKVSGKTDVRSNEGAFGILSENLYTRSQAFESALINAMIPFLNTTYYSQKV